MWLVKLYGRLVSEKGILLLFIIFISPIVTAQETFHLSGYVIGENQIQPGVNVSVKGTKVTVETDFKGKFRIECAIGDTLTFEKKYSLFVIEEYVIADSLPVIVKLEHKMELDQKGRRRLYGTVTSINTLPKVYFIGTINKDRFWGGGYNFWLRPLFPDNLDLPVLNRVALGFAVYSNGNDYCFFPNVGLNIRSYYHNPFNSRIDFSFLAPSVKLGPWISNESKAGFGYELALTLLNFSFSSASPFRNISMDVRYNNFLNNKGAFMVGICLNKAFPVNKIPKYIKEAIK